MIKKVTKGQSELQGETILKTLTNITGKTFKFYSYSKGLKDNSTFSFGDWFQLIRDERIGAMTVVTNQGNVFMLNKNNKFDYNVFRDKLFNISTKYDINKLDDKTHKIIMDGLLKFSSNNGIDYIRGESYERYTKYK